MIIPLLARLAPLPLPRALLLPALAATLLVWTGCGDGAVVDGDPDPDPALETVRVEDLEAFGTEGHYTFFSLRENEIVPLADSASTDWDLAFKTTTILVNGGTSGPGQGGALLLDGSPIEEVVEAPEDGYRVDNGINLAIPIGSGNGWYVYEDTSRLIFPIAPLTIVVRCADGTYAKVKIVSYYKGAPDVPPPLSPDFQHYTFEYVHQPNGSRALD